MVSGQDGGDRRNAANPGWSVCPLESEGGMRGYCGAYGGETSGNDTGGSIYDGVGRLRRFDGDCAECQSRTLWGNESFLQGKSA